jgi:hypothetical protein
MDDQEKKAAILKDLQASLDEMKTLPQYRQYVEMRKLSLLDTRFELMDKLLTAGVLK